MWGHGCRSFRQASACPHACSPGKRESHSIARSRSRSRNGHAWLRTTGQVRKAGDKSGKAAGRGIVLPIAGKRRARERRRG